MFVRTIISSLAALFISCSTPPPHADPSAPGAVPTNLVLRSYDVPSGGAQQLRGVLAPMLWFGSDGPKSEKYVGRVDVGPDGRLLVLAPELVHEGVKQLIAAAAANPTNGPGTVRLDYWVVSGVPGKSDALAANLQEVAAALTEVDKNDGPMAFSLVEKLTLSTLSNEGADLAGRETKVHQRIHTAFGNEVTANIDIERFGQRLSTYVRIKPGVITVLASAGMTNRSDAKDAPPENRTIYFLVRAADGTGR